MDHRRHVEAVRDLLCRDGVDVPVRLWDGTDLGEGPFRVVLRHPWSLRAILVPPSDLNVGEAYLRDDVDLEGDMVAALHTIARLRDEVGWIDRARVARHVVALPKPPDDLGATDRVAILMGRNHTRQRDRQAVQFHYDLGNDFFRQFLDDDLVYSCAYFGDASTSLEAAQRRKLDTVVRKLHLQPGDRLLDVGCGWGSLVIHAARVHPEVTAVGVTLSRRQVELARRRVAAAGLEDRVEIRLADYRELAETFDAVASVGMVEHVGSGKLPTYFQCLYDLLVDGGRLLNHGITTGWRPYPRDLEAESNTFVGRHVFPDGGLVPIWHTQQVAHEAGFEVLDVQQLRPHYALTLREWVRRLEANHDAAVAAASEETWRTWRAYMSGSVVGFETGDLGLAQVLLGKGAQLPLDRSFMAPRLP